MYLLGLEIKYCSCEAASRASSDGGNWTKRSPARLISVSYGRSWGIWDSRWWTMAMSHSQSSTSSCLYSTICNTNTNKSKRQWVQLLEFIKFGRLVTSPDLIFSLKYSLQLQNRWALTDGRPGRSHTTGQRGESQTGHGQTRWSTSWEQRLYPPQLWQINKKHHIDSHNVKRAWHVKRLFCCICMIFSILYFGSCNKQMLSNTRKWFVSCIWNCFTLQSIFKIVTHLRWNSYESYCCI